MPKRVPGKAEVSNEKLVYQDNNEYNLRKLRKKLRQIEKLQQLNRHLSEEEKLKIASQDEIRKQIQDIISNDVKQGCRNESSCEYKPHGEQPLIDFNAGTEELQESPVSVKAFNEKSNINASEANDSLVNSSVDLETEATNNPDASTVDWTNELFRVSTLTGHNDIIYCVDADETYIVTCSRDTTVKVWDALTGKQLNSLRGHTAAVTSVILVPFEAGIEMTVKLRWKQNQRIAISGGLDCMIYIWSILDGIELHSVYTYNGITCLGYFQAYNCLISGTEGGKVDLWNLPSLENLHSLSTFEEAILQIKIHEDKYACVSTSEGIVIVIELRDKELHRIFSSEGVLSRYNNMLIPRSIRSLEAFHNNIYYGDDGVNVKVMDWKLGTAKKVLNSLNPNGLTDAIRRTDQEIIFSNYDLDVGTSCLNIYKLPENVYAASLIDDDDTERIVSISCTRVSSGSLRIITAGTKLKIWNAAQTDQNNEMQESKIVRASVIPEYFSTEIHSDDDWSESNDADPDAEDAQAGRYEVTFYAEDMERKRGFWSWCNVL